MADKAQSLPVMRLGHSNGNITTVGFGYQPDHDDLHVLLDADHDQLNDLSKTRRTWALSLPNKHRPYFTHIMEIDHLWPAHGDAPPVWVSCPDHPELEKAVAEHFSSRGHEVQVGEPEGSED